MPATNIQTDIATAPKPERIRAHIPARRTGKSLDTVAAILSGPSGNTLRMRALRAANVERARRRLPPMRWAEMSASGRMHFLLAEAKAASGSVLPAPVAKARAAPAPSCARCGRTEDVRRFLRRDIGERAFCPACAGALADELTELPPPPPPPPADADAPEQAKPCCQYCGDAVPLIPVFTNGIGWSQLCADCADTLCGDLPPDDEHDDDDPDAATGCADDHL